MKIQAILYLLLFGLALILASNKHGKQREGKDNFWYTLIAVIIEFVLLYTGGFFNND